jgi:hypothetical protein
MIRKVNGFKVLSEKGKNLGGPYPSRKKAEGRLRQVEAFKHMGGPKAHGCPETHARPAPSL